MGRPYVTEHSAYAEIQCGSWGVVLIVNYQVRDSFTDRFLQFNFTGNQIRVGSYISNTSDGSHYYFAATLIFPLDNNYTVAESELSENYLIFDFPYEITGLNLYGAWTPSDYPVTSSTFVYGETSQALDKLDEILNALGSLNGQDFPSADEGLNSDISSIEDTESSLVSGSQGNYNSAVSSGTDSVLDFFNSAGSSLTMVRNVFNNLVSGNIWILVSCAIFLSILPLIVNVFRGFH